MKLLYAEDEIGMSEAVVDILLYHKYLVDAVYDGEEALAYAHTEAYDGMILDIMMPKKAGWKYYSSFGERETKYLYCF